MSNIDELINHITKNTSKQTLNEIKIKGCVDILYGLCDVQNPNPKPRPPLRMIAYEDMLRELDK